MASNCEKIPFWFKMGDLVYSFPCKCKGKCGDTWLSVICPDFGSYGNYTEVRKIKKGDIRFYHIQRLGSSDELEHDWVPQEELWEIKTDHDRIRTVHSKVVHDRIHNTDLDDCKMFAEKAVHERIEICKVRAEIFNLKSENTDLKSQLKSLKKSCDKFETFLTTQNQNNPQNEEESNASNENIENKNQNSGEGENAGESKLKDECDFEEPPKKIKLEDQSEEIERLNHVINDLKEGNLNLQKEVAKLSKANDDYEEVQIQNEATVKKLREENLKIHQESQVIIKDLKKDNFELSKENAKLSKAKEEYEDISSDEKSESRSYEDVDTRVLDELKCGSKNGSF